jgi:ABC-type Fe3+ transport system substrate-binding protein
MNARIDVIALVVGLAAIVLSAYLLVGIYDTVNSLDAKLDVLTETIEGVYGVDLAMITGALEERKLTIYSSYVREGILLWAQIFRQKYPFIEVDLVGGTSSQVEERFVTDQKAGVYQADIFAVTDPSSLLSMTRQGFLSPYTVAVDEIYTDKEKIVVNGSDYAYCYTTNFYPVAYNTELVTEEEVALLDTWEGITNPVWKDRCAIVYPTGGGLNAMWYQWYSDYGTEFLEDIAALNPVIYYSNIPAGERLAAGEHAVILSMHEGSISTWAQKGAPVKWTFPPPSMQFTLMQGVVETAPHPNAARLFQEWALSLEGQEAYVRCFGDYPYDKRVTPQWTLDFDWYEAPVDIISPLDVFDDWDDWATKRAEIVTIFRDVFGIM